MNKLVRRKESGQSIPLIALMIVVLFGLVGLSVDVGNTYAEQRTVVRATNAASIAAMDAVIKGYNDTGVAKVIRESLGTNGLDLMGESASGSGDNATVEGNRTVIARYMNVDGEHISNCEIGRCGSIPADVNYIEIEVKGDVETFFARVVGQPTLPVDARAYAGRCPPTGGVYPIAIWNGDLDENGFKAPTGSGINLAEVYGKYSDGLYSKPWRRIFLKDNGTEPGNFSFLRWTNAKQGANDLAAALTGDGTLDDGFDEAAWPKNGDPMPNNYPLAPHSLSIKDWIHGDSGLSWSNGGDGVRPALEKLMTSKTQIMLPIVDKSAGQGVNSQFQLARLGKFYIVDPFPGDANNGGIAKNGGKNAYLDLVYLGPVNETACLVTNVDPPTNDTSTPPSSLTVRIPFQVNPRWTGTDKPAQPIAYQLVVDVSGSMSHNFPGNGTIGGVNYRCEYGSKDTTYPYNDTCQGGPNSPWSKESERRIYITKQAIQDFIDDLGPNDTMRFTAFSTGVGTGNVKVVPSTGYSNDKTLLSQELKTLGSYKSNPYLTQGGTPGPQAMLAARDVILKAPSKAPNGQEYRRVVIYLTDGVANVYLNGTGNTARDICGDRSEMAARNDPYCQTGFSKTAGMLRPISAMIDEANKIKQADSNVQIYVIALAGVATEGLSQVASSPSMMYRADQPGVVDSILNTIRERATGASCLALGGSKYYDRITPQQQAQFTGEFALQPGVYGKATIYNENGTVPITTADIIHDDFSGALGIQADLPPGNYQIGAWIGYKGEDTPKPMSRVYNSLSRDQVNFSGRLSFTIQPNTSLNDTRVLDPVYVDLDSTVKLCK